MPHSSGGGSHGGGFHGGGGHHGGRGGSGARIARKKFPGARCFMYYVHGTPYYVYSGKPIVRQSVPSLVIQLVFLVPFVLLGLFILFSGAMLLAPPKPLTPSAAYEQYHIEDTLDVIGNESELESVLRDFQAQTGICPYIVTTDTSIWSKKFSSLEKFAYDTYVRKFSDEKHFLIVYSAPVNSDPERAENWSWEGMQGDSTDPILTEDNMEKFNRFLYNSLESGTPVGTALCDTFRDSLGYLMKRGDVGGGVTSIVFGAVWLVIMVYVLYKSIMEFSISRKELIEVPADSGHTHSDKDI